jgi:hypothetical protein
VTMDTVDHMLIRIGDHTADIQHYATLRQRLRREYGGFNVNPALQMLEEAVDVHLHMANVAIWESIGLDDSALERELAVATVDENLFDAGRLVCGNNLAADCLLHAAVLRQAGICETMFDEFKELVLTTAEAMR